MALDFRTLLESMKMSFSLSKILETVMNVYKSIFLIIKNKNIIKYPLYTNTKGYISELEMPALK